MHNYLNYFNLLIFNYFITKGNPIKITILGVVLIGSLMVVFVVLSKETISIKKVNYSDDLEKCLKDEIKHKNIEILL